MQQHNVYFLNAHGAIMRHTQVDVGVGKQGCHFATPLSADGNDGHVAVVSSLYGAGHVGWIATGRNGDQDITRLAQGLDLAFEYGRITVIVANRGKDGSIGVKRKPGQWQTLAFETANKLGNEVLGISGGPSIATGQYAPVVGQGGDRQLYRLCQGRRHGSGAVLKCLDGGIKMRCHVRSHVHSQYCRMLAGVMREQFVYTRVWSNAWGCHVSCSASRTTTSNRQTGVWP